MSELIGVKYETGVSASAPTIASCQIGPGMRTTEDVAVVRTVDRDVAHRVFVRRFWITRPNSRRKVRGVPGEPNGVVVVSRSGLTGSRTTDGHRRSGRVWDLASDHANHDVVHCVGHLWLDDLVALRFRAGHLFVVSCWSPT